MEINRNFQGEEQTTIFNLYTMWFTKIDRFKKKTENLKMTLLFQCFIAYR